MTFYTNEPGPHRARFELLVERTETCWLWTGRIGKGGYGRLGPRLAHRAAYELFVGPVPQGFELDHLCRTPNCVNPQHLEPVTPEENWLRSHNPARINADKTHCKNGHEFTPENTLLNTRNRPSRRPYRRCRKCTQARQRAWYAARKAAS